MIRQIFLWEVNCTPWNEGPINSMTMYVVANNRKEAESIVHEQAHKFFEQDMHYTWKEPLIQGYQKID